jgi:hypothetical protein
MASVEKLFIDILLPLAVAEAMTARRWRSGGAELCLPASAA